MRVIPPPPPVPRLIVVNSRMTLRSPISRCTVSPRNFLSCGSPPIAAWPWTRLSRPIRVGPWMLQCGPMRVPSPISTPGPTRVKAPILTPSPRLADGSTLAVGCTCAADAMSGRDLRAQDLRAGHLPAVHARGAGVQGHVADLAPDRHFQVQPVAGHDHAREPGLVHLDQVGNAPGQVLRPAQVAEDAAGLRDRLDHQHARHHRLPGEVTLEERLVATDVLVAQHPLARLRLDHAVDQQERIAVGQQLPDGVDVHRNRWWCLAHSFPFSMAVTRRASASSWRSRTALRRHSRAGTAGRPEEYSPGSVMLWLTMLIAVTVTLSQMSRCPAAPAAPANMQ